MANTEIKLNPETLGSEVTAVLSQKNRLTIKSGGSCSGSSIAMDEFIAVYGVMEKALREYRELLANDMQSIRAIISRMEEQDRKEAGGLKGNP